MAKKEHAPADYEVGKGKPPKHTQFQRGQSGNPGGRNKGSRNLKTIIAAVMESEIELSENGRKRKVPIVEAIFWRLAQDAMRGQPRAVESLLARYERYVTCEPELRDEVPEEDRILLERAFRRATVATDGEGDDV